jgi:hypothetical protein
MKRACRTNETGRAVIDRAIPDVVRREAAHFSMPHGRRIGALRWGVQVAWRQILLHEVATIEPWFVLHGDL